jgi:hypothetical protein
MPSNEKRNLGYAASALSTGGKRLGELTGEEEPELEQKDFLSQGFRRLAGVQAPVRKYGSDD